MQDATEAVEQKVKKKFQESGGWRKLVASRAARAASGIASPPMIASMLAEKIPQKMIDLMEEKGITVAVHEEFRAGPYVVFSVQVIKVDAVVLANSKKEKNETGGNGFFQMGALVGVGLGMIGSNNQQWVEEGYLPKIVHRKLERAMGEILAEKLEKKKMVAETYVLGEANQARYFFAKHREIQSLKPTGFKSKLRNSASGQGSRALSRSNSNRSIQTAPTDTA